MSTATTTRSAIHVRVALHADLRKYFAKGTVGAQPFELENGETVADLLALLGIPAEEIVTVGINGELAERNTILHDRDDVTMFSPMEGG